MKSEGEIRAEIEYMNKRVERLMAKNDSGYESMINLYLQKIQALKWVLEEA